MCVCVLSLSCFGTSIRVTVASVNVLRCVSSSPFFWNLRKLLLKFFKCLVGFTNEHIGLGLFFVRRFLITDSIFVLVTVLVSQLCLTLWDPTDCSLPGFSVYGILQARILKWVAILFSSRSQLRGQNWVSGIVGIFFTIWVSREALLYICSNFLFLLDLVLISIVCGFFFFLGFCHFI